MSAIRCLRFFPAVHILYTRYGDAWGGKHKNLSFWPMNPVDEYFESEQISKVARSPRPARSRKVTEPQNRRDRKATKSGICCEVYRRFPESRIGKNAYGKAPTGKGQTTRQRPGLQAALGLHLRLRSGFGQSIWGCTNIRSEAGNVLQGAVASVEFGGYT